MKHARAGYDKTMKKIPKDEPVFVLRAQDVAAADAVRYWAAVAQQKGAAPEIVSAAIRHADLMDQWPTKKIPDMPESAVEQAAPDTWDGKGVRGGPVS